MDILQAGFLVVLGVVVGTNGTLIGAGRGFLLVPVLLFMYPHEKPATVTTISLAVVFFNALSGSVAYGRMRRIDFKSGALFAIATVPGAVLGALAVSFVSRGLFSVVFGAVLVVISALSFLSVREKISPDRPASVFWKIRTLVDQFGQRHTYAFDLRIGLALSFVVGFLSSLLGIGGGIVHVPALIHLLHFPVHIATATSQFVLVVTSLTGSAVHVAAGELTPGTGLVRVLLLSAGVLPGAQIGARLAMHVRGTWIIRLLALALTLVGLRLVALGILG